jgi:peptide/nickel transport system substrate-binding protein
MNDQWLSTHDMNSNLPAPSTISRRRFLQTSALGGVALGGSGLLAACAGGSSVAPSTSTGQGGSARHGGTLTAAMTSGATTDTLDAHTAVTQVAWAYVNSLYDPLVYMQPNAQFEMWLAEEITPNPTATEWTIRLRPGVTFHNGKPLVADDVIFSLQRILNPKNPLEGAGLLTPIDATALAKVDDLTVKVPCTTPFSTFVEVLGLWLYDIVPVGYDPSRPVGTGPFEYQSFTPGVRAVFTRNPNYWRHPYPYIDKLVINDFSDETSQVNALMSGAAQAVNNLSLGSVRALRSSGKQVLVSDSGGFDPFTMRVDQAPFNDVRVRQAMRLICDRKQMVELIFGGYGTIGNDVFSIFDAAYDHSIPQREQDIPQAKALLKAAGRDGMSVQLTTSDIGPGTLLVAQVLAEQAKAAGVTVNLDQVTSTVLYGPTFLKWTFAQDLWFYNPYLAQAALTTLPTAPFNETHFNNARYGSLYAEAQRTVDVAKRYELEHEMMAIDYDEGGMIIPYFTPLIDGYQPQVHGFVPSKTGLSFNSYNFAEMWLA